VSRCGRIAMLRRGSGRRAVLDCRVAPDLSPPGRSLSPRDQLMGECMAGKKKNSRKLDAERRRREAAAARREAHAKLVVDRHDDPRYVQQRRSPTGRTIEWNSESSSTGKQLGEALRAQRALFVEKFGREPGPNDPIFFDPDADEPTPLGVSGEMAMWEDMMAAAERAGLDPALIHAARELGFLLTEANQHLFSAMEVEAWRQAVLSYRGEADDD
jgi:hypothetical protein